MPDGRMINKKIVDNERLGQVSIEAEFLFWRMIPFLDREGRLSFTANPVLISKKLYPMRDITPGQIQGWLQELAAQKKAGHGLVELYDVEGRQYLWMPGFKGEQSKSWLNTTYKREAESDIPSPPGVEDPPPPQRLNAEDILDPRLAAMVKCYENNFPGALAPPDYEKLKDFSREYPEEGWFEKAVAEAIKNKAYNLAYVEKILERYRREGGPSGKPGKHSKQAEPKEPLEDSIGKPLH